MEYIIDFVVCIPSDPNGKSQMLIFPYRHPVEYNEGQELYHMMGASVLFSLIRM
jgi:hypothetical protein